MSTGARIFEIFMGLMGAAVVIVFARYEFDWPWFVGVILAPFGALAVVLLVRARAML